MTDTIEPDTKDWTWVLERPCPECGFDAARVDRARAARTRSATTPRSGAACSPARRRGTGPRRDVWSPLEYACHVRDVHRVFDERVRLMLDEDDPRFANWDQDETAVERRYAEQDPAIVADELVDAAAAVAATCTPAVAGDAVAAGRGAAATAACSPSRASAATTSTTSSTTSSTWGRPPGPLGPACGGRHEAHGVLGADGAGARAGATPAAGPTSW